MSISKEKYLNAIVRLDVADFNYKPGNHIASFGLIAGDAAKEHNKALDAGNYKLALEYAKIVSNYNEKARRDERYQDEHHEDD